MKTILMFGLMFVLLSSVVFAAIPETISVQGRLTTPEGYPMVGEHEFVFKLCDSGDMNDLCWESGSALWDSTRNVNLDSNGIFNVNLGELHPLTDEVCIGNVGKYCFDDNR